VLFNSFIFIFVFLPVTYGVFWALRNTTARYVWLTATGYVFYGYWDARFCLLMAFSTLVSYGAGLGFLRWSDERRRKLCLVVPIVVDLSLLGFFKYSNFALQTTQSALHLAGVDFHAPRLNIVLPIGISFYTFHTITYIVDCYRGVVRPTRKFFEFATYVSLFSQLVAGPIVRFRQIEQDLDALGTSDRRRWLSRGISFFAIGLVEKVLIADTMAGFVDPALAHYETLSTVGTWMAMLGYSFQLYFDFSGYSTMAVGLGYLFGIRIPQNFNSPYKATDPSDFWRRWHISLSTVLRDYLYIPLGGNRSGEWKTYRNLLVTMLLGGLWHGASWTFVAWGAYHGLLLAAYRAWGTRWDRLSLSVRKLGTFILVVVGWVFFRSTGFAMALHIIERMFVPVGGALVTQASLAAPALVVGAWLAMVGPNAFELSHDYRWRGRIAIVSGVAASLAVIAGLRTSPFLYFQF
jgi:alginate O-acetyltransferase complex protein AlgI